jgi:hypothetical protein
MDAKPYPNLNPKLKETYDRIMGTTTTVKMPHPAETHTAKNPSPAHQTVARAQVTPAARTTTPVHASTGQLTHIAYNASMAAKKEKAHTAANDKEVSSLLLPILLATGGVVFFVVYSIFWLNFFGMN